MVKPGATRKQKPPPRKTDKEQSERFKETARKLGVDEREETFESVFKKLVPARRVQK